MKQRLIDAHIHLDMYSNQESQQILKGMDDHLVDALIAVSNHLSSSQSTLELARKDHRVKAAFGYHPEQSLPTSEALEALHQFIHRNQEEMVAVGEVGLPYYLRKDNGSIPIEPYIETLEQFIQLSAAINKPVILHAVYDDAPIVCDLLEKHGVTNAHFYWFKGDRQTMERMRENGYVISLTPDVLYEEEIQRLAKLYPLDKIMMETDGPWPFAGLFDGKRTHPSMIHESLSKLAEIKRMDPTTVYQQVYENTTRFYRLDSDPAVKG